MRKYYRLGRIFGIEIVLHYSWFLIFAFLAYTLTRDYFPQNFPNLSLLNYAVIGVVSALSLFVSVLMHELCHSLVAKHYHIPIKRIQLFFFGGIAEINDNNIKPKMEFLMALAGPVFSITFGVVCLYLLKVAPATTVSPVLHYLGRINLVLGIFNMMPGFPLDGGRVLRAVLWGISKDYEKSTYYATRSGKLFGALFVILGFFSIFMGNAGGLWSILIGGFLFFIADLSFEQVVIKKSLLNIKVGNVYQKKYDYLAPEATASEAINNIALHSSQDFFPVLDKKKNFLGAVSLRRINQVPEQIKHKIKIESLMIPAIKIPKLTINQEVYPILMDILRQGYIFFPVVEKKKLIGIVTKEILVHYLKIKAIV